MGMQPPTQRKMLFTFLTDEGEETETMWVIPRGHDVYEIANTPFYVQGIACGDEAEGCENDRSELMFVRVLRSVGHSTIRVVMFDEGKREAVCKAFEDLGCQIEIADIRNLLAIDVPPTTSWESVQQLLNVLGSSGTIDWEEAAISRHHVP